MSDPCVGVIIGEASGISLRITVYKAVESVWHIDEQGKVYP
jgi:hypothetical protein